MVLSRKVIGQLLVIAVRLHRAVASDSLTTPRLLKESFQQRGSVEGAAIG
jgi:hypothetical protein